MHTGTTVEHNQASVTGFSTAETQPDALSPLRTIVHMLVTGAVAAVATVVAWFIMSRPSLPAYNTSYVLKALSSVGSVLVILFAAVSVYYVLHPRTNWSNWQRRVLAVLLYLAPAGLVITSIGIPLAATSLYLDGVSVDQAFRTQFLTRLTDTPGWVDMAYPNMPSFYPGLWFFTGGLFARITGLAGWAAYQPWALMTLAAAFSMLVPLWRHLTGSLASGATVALVTAVATLHVAPEEPYAAIVAVGMPAAMVMTRHALLGSRWALFGVMVYLGLSANLYTLFTALSALSVVVMAIAAAIRQKGIRPLLSLLAMGVGSILIALLGWFPYLRALLTQPHGPTGKAQHYLPEDGTALMMPFFDLSALGVLTLIGLVWLVARHRQDDARALLVGILTAYGWAVASMAMPLLGTTLLGFRVALPIALLFAVAGALAIIDLRGVGMPKFYPATVDPAKSRGVTRVFAAILAFGTLYYAIDIPMNHEKKIDTAYTDADGNAMRGDRMPADATVYYAQIDEHLAEKLGKRSGSTILTDEQHFMSFYPYHAYQAMTAHYANPLGEFERRNEEIESWTQITDPDELIAAMDRAAEEEGWTAPDALVLRGEVPAEEGGPAGSDATPMEEAEFSYLIADDIYPNQPNVRFRTVHFPASAFQKHWDVTQIGPFAVAVRN
ncbi:galactan 5-O-arabinofuranosyltransferase [Corynebacterium urealyticum]|nr:galactan 5-O-arabinofuranosyltransferase [Corynebacterium urealyticum]